MSPLTSHQVFDVKIPKGSRKAFNVFTLTFTSVKIDFKNTYVNADFLIKRKTEPSKYVLTAEGLVVLRA